MSKLAFMTLVITCTHAVLAQTIFFSDDFESGSLSNWGTQKNDPGQSYAVIDDGTGNNVAQMVHTKGQGRALIGNSSYPGFSELQCVATFNVSVADNTTAGPMTSFKEEPARGAAFRGPQRAAGYIDGTSTHAAGARGAKI